MSCASVERTSIVSFPVSGRGVRLRLDGWPALPMNSIFDRHIHFREREKNYETNSTGLHGIRFAGVRFAFTAGDSGMQ